MIKIKKELLEIPFDCLNGLIIEPCITFNANGMAIKTFTECNTAMFIFDLPKEKFIEYEFEGEQKFKVQADLLAKIMKRIKTENVNLEFKDEKLIISDEKKKEYSIAVMHDDDAQRDMPQLELTSNFKMKSSELQNLFLDAGVVGEELRLATEDKLSISSGELNKFHQDVECEVVGVAKANYSLEYLNKFLVASKYFENVLFEFNSDSPCKLTFEGDLKIQFILAPRCEQE